MTKTQTSSENRFERGGPGLGACMAAWQRAEAWRPADPGLGGRAAQGVGLFAANAWRCACMQGSVVTTVHA